MYKKILSTLILIVFITVNSSQFVFATDEATPISVHVRIEGVNSTIAESDEGFQVIGVTAWDAVKLFLDSSGISYSASNSQYGIYVSAVNGEQAGTFGGYDGWLYAVNGVSPRVGIGDYQIEDNDNIIFYYGGYGPDTLIPTITVSPQVVRPGSNFTVTVSATYYDYISDGNTTQSISDAKLTFNGEEYLTNSNGTAILTAPNVAGNYKIKVSKDRQGDYPLLVRSTQDVSIQNSIVVCNTSLVMQENTSVACSAAIQNYTDETITPYVLAAVYRNNRILYIKRISQSDLSINSGAGKQLNMDITIPPGGCVVKLFVLKSLDSLSPLCENSSLTIEP